MWLFVDVQCIQKVAFFVEEGFLLKVDPGTLSKSEGSEKEGSDTCMIEKDTEISPLQGMREAGTGIFLSLGMEQGLTTGIDERGLGTGRG